MQKSKKMMVSLCGLALSSLFVLNNKSVVHADTVDGTQNNAISWNSDSDAAQNVQNTQKADDDQQNVQSVQPSRAETSTVRSVSAAPRTTNQNTAVQSPKISNINDAQAAVPVVINNPAYNNVHVHYVDRNGNDVDYGSYDYDIDVAKTGQGSYSVPYGYSLNNPDGKYIVSGGAFNETNLYASLTPVAGQTRQVWHDAVSYPSEWDNPRIWGFNAYTGSDKKTEYLSSEEADFIANDPSTNDQYHEGGTGTTFGFGGQWYGYRDRLSSAPQSLLDKMADMFGTSDQSVWGAVYTEGTKIRDAYTEPGYYETVTVSSGYTNQTLPVAFVDSNNNIVGMIQNYTGKVGTTRNISLTVPTGYKLADGVSLPTNVTFRNSTNPLLIKVVPNETTTTESQTFTRNITITKPDGTKTNKQQTVTFKRDVTKDSNGHLVKQTDWKADGSDTFPEIKLDSIKGYTPNQQIPAEKVDVNKTQANQAISVNYIANQENAKLQVLDDDNGGKVVPGFDLTAQGAFNTPIHFGTYNTHADLERALTDKHYQIVSDNWQDNKFDDGANVNQFAIHVKHTKTPPTAQDKPDYDENVTRTIHFVNEQGDEIASPTVQSTPFTRTGEKDEVTGSIDYSDWKQNGAGWKAITTPKIHGYTADKDTIPAVDNPDPSKTNTDVNVTYTGNEITITVDIVDKATGKTLKEISQTGKYGQPYDLKLPDIAGYHMAKKQTLNGSFGSSSTIKIYYEKDADPRLDQLRNQINAKEQEAQDFQKDSDYANVPKADQDALTNAMQDGQTAVNNKAATVDDLQKALDNLTNALNKAKQDLQNFEQNKANDQNQAKQDTTNVNGTINPEDKAKLDQDLPEMSEAKSSLAFAGIATALITGLSGYAVIKKHKHI